MTFHFSYIKGSVIVCKKEILNSCLFRVCPKDLLFVSSNVTARPLEVSKTAGIQILQNNSVFSDLEKKKKTTLLQMFFILIEI